jgi:uncharacterized protein YbcI
MMSGHGGPDSPRRRTLGASTDATQLADRIADRVMKSAGRLWYVQSERNSCGKITRKIRLFKVEVSRSAWQQLMLKCFAILDICSPQMKTQGEIESAISEGMGRFEQEYMGRGPKDVRAYLLGDLVVIRLKGVLTAAEQHLVKTLPSDKGRDLLKQVRSHLIEIARPMMEAMVQGITGVKVVSLHHDISTLTGEEVVLFTLAEVPALRESKKR